MYSTFPIDSARLLHLSLKRAYFLTEHILRRLTLEDLRNLLSFSARETTVDLGVWGFLKWGFPTSCGINHIQNDRCMIGNPWFIECL